MPTETVYVAIREARAADAPAMARVLIDTRRIAHRDHIPEQSLLRFTYEESERNWARTLRELGASSEANECIYVAETEAGEVVGLAMGGPERTSHRDYAGEVYILYLLPEYQRRGIGRRLTRTVAARLIGWGMNSFLIRVLKANAPARRFYEALGGQLVLEEQIEEDGALLDQVAYGWPDARRFLDEN
jgi:ribosomal protein S18 acetylase RimI-like enzyme